MKYNLKTTLASAFESVDTLRELMFLLNYEQELFFKKPVDNFNIGKVENLTFGQVNDLAKLINNTTSLSDMVDVLKYLNIELKGAIFHKVTQQYYYLVEQVQALKNNEQKALAHEPTALEELAGLERFKPFSQLAQERKVAEIYKVTRDVVRNWKYKTVFVELVYDKTVNDYKRDLQELSRK